MKAFLFVLIFPCLSFSSKAQTEADSLDWLLVYYMPYDNDLSKFGEDIVKMCQQGVLSAKIKVVIQADFDDTLGMERIVISRNGIERTQVESEYSANGKEFERFLEWTAQEFKFRHSMISLLDHGGRLNEVCLDEYPNRSFLSIKDVEKGLKRFQKQSGKKADLLFYQVCSKSSIEALYQVHKYAQYTLASQMEIGAPNYYYKNVLLELGNGRIANGQQLAQKISDEFRFDMYRYLTCVNNSKFEEYRRLFKSYVKQIDKRVDFGFTASPVRLEYSNEAYWDLESFLSCINSSTQTELDLQGEVIDFVFDELIVILKKNHYYSDPIDYCGINISTLSRAKIRDYRALRFYRHFGITRLDLE